MIKQIIINADDFGLKSSVNKAIADSFNKGLINSTSLMANMPGFDEAVDLAHKNNTVSQTGIHLTLTEGNPLTSEIIDSNLFFSGNNNGLKEYKRRLFFLSKEESTLIYNEFSAQIERLKKAGIKITHIDTHHHVDDLWSITKIILELLRAYNIPSMRILNNLNRTVKLYKTAYRKIINSVIKFNKAGFSDFFGDQIEGFSLLRNNISLCDGKKLEIMVHPDYNDEGILINRIQKQEIILDFPDDLKKVIDPHAHICVH